MKKKSINPEGALRSRFRKLAKNLREHAKEDRRLAKETTLLPDRRGYEGAAQAMEYAARLIEENVR